MIQRIQTLYLLVAAVAMMVCAYFTFKTVAVGIAALVAAGLSLYTISLYKKRPLQATICRILCFVGVAFVGYFSIGSAGNYAQKDYLYPVGATVLAIFCWLFANIAIRKDEKLVRSLDRIR